MTSTGFFKGVIGVLFKLRHLNMIYFLIWPKNLNLYHRFAGKRKLNAVSISQSKIKQAWFPWCLMPIGTIQHLNTQSTVLTSSSVLVAIVVYGEWRWQPQQNLLNSYIIIDPKLHFRNSARCHAIYINIAEFFNIHWNVLLCLLISSITINVKA